MNLTSIGSVRQFIESQWTKTIRHQHHDEGTLIGLPFPYTVPCSKESFQEIYYWDTFFTCVGLLAQGRVDLAEANIKNLCNLIDRFGFVPNGNRTYYLNRSQPPYLAAMVELLRYAGGDTELVQKATAALDREYGFWQNQRMTPTGLCRYSHHANKAELEEFCLEVRDRAHLAGVAGSALLKRAGSKLAEAESGWDFTQRFQHRCDDFCPIDLNCNLFSYEKLMADLSDSDDARVCWESRGETRKKLINDLCWNEKEGAYFDYDYERRERSLVLTAATFQPLWTGIASQPQADAIVAKTLPRLEYPHGIVPCRRFSDFPATQWEAPNLWPCLQYIAYRGLDRYGFVEEARRIARKYVEVVCHGFLETGDLWEKYNAEDGTTNSKGEPGFFSAPAMMGWTAGVFLDASDYLATSEEVKNGSHGGVDPSVLQGKVPCGARNL